MFFNTFVQRGVGFLILAAIVYLLLRLLVFRPKQGKNIDRMTSADFEKEIYQVYEHCSETSLNLFRAFLVKYEEQNPRAFSVKEKGELKSLFLEIVVPESDVSVSTKEQFRVYLKKIGVSDMNIRPRYSQCTLGHLSGQKTKEDYFNDYCNIKIGDCLKNGLDSQKYKIFDSPTVVDGEKKKRIAFIVIGDSGTFVINTKDLGTDVHETGIDPTEIFIKKGDNWTVRKKDNEMDVTSPTEEVLEAKNFIEQAMGDMLLDVHSVVVFPDEQLNIYQEEELPYKVIGTRNLCNYIREYPNRMSLNERTEILSRLNKMITE